MGTINYGTSDYITMGIKPYDYNDFTSDPEFMEEMRHNAEMYGTTIEDEIYNYIAELYECDKANFETERKKHYFWYYHIALKPGYYDGLYIDIENNFGIAYDSFEDRKNAQKEITEIKAFLKECAGFGFVACFPGWCTGYCDYSETLQLIDSAITEMRNECRTIPTWRQYERDSK